MFRYQSDLRYRLARAILTGDLKREGTLEENADMLRQVLETDSLDVIELILAMKEKGIVTVGRFLEFLEGGRTI